MVDAEAEGPRDPAAMTGGTFGGGGDLSLKRSVGLLGEAEAVGEGRDAWKRRETRGSSRDSKRSKTTRVQTLTLLARKYWVPLEIPPWKNLTSSRHRAGVVDGLLGATVKTAAYLVAKRDIGTLVP
ncbi:hypothetical protein NL676_013643 [Syzygium grande]|nr:hypothetical protein NL676_013643 [Syzygium grande]